VQGTKQNGKRDGKEWQVARRLPVVGRGRFHPRVHATGEPVSDVLVPHPGAPDALEVQDIRKAMVAGLQLTSLRRTRVQSGTQVPPYSRTGQRLQRFVQSVPEVAEVAELVGEQESAGAGRHGLRLKFDGLNAIWQGPF
jgi:hypothetical protein